MKRKLFLVVTIVLAVGLLVGCPKPASQPDLPDDGGWELPVWTLEPGATLEPISPRLELPESDEPDGDPIAGYFALGKSALLPQLGTDYEIVPSGAEGLYDGYYYAGLGLTFVFEIYDEDWETLLWIDCDPSFVLHGAHGEMTFGEISCVLGEGEAEEYIAEDTVTPIYARRYQMGDYVMEFTSFEPDGSWSWLTLYRALLV